MTAGLAAWISDSLLWRRIAGARRSLPELGRSAALAEPHVALMAFTVSAAAAARRGGWSAGLAPCLTVTTGASVRRMLSRAVARPRPPAAYWLTEPEGFSLPSKHTCLAALTAGACASALGCGPAVSQAAALAAAAAVGTGRVCLGVHWPTDVLAAWLFATGWLNLARLARPRQMPAGLGPEAGGRC